MNQVEIYQTKDKQTEIEVKFEGDTVWLAQDQMTRLFGRDRTVITKHINNVFKEGELDKESNVQKMHITKSDKPVSIYSLDVIISVGYRVKGLMPICTGSSQTSIGFHTMAFREPFAISNG